MTVYVNTDFEDDSASGSREHRVRSVCDYAAELGCAGININHRLCSPSVVTTARSRGLLVSVWTVSPADGFRRFVEMSVDNITTRSVAALVALRDYPS
jgi:glycerophosphoryl diester phosphodiesterase